MSMITFSEKPNLGLMACESGLPLVSTTHPQEQALKWVYSLGSMPTSHVIVIGLGAGFHVEALADFDPNLRITVVESRESLLPIFRAQFSELQDRVEIVIVKEAQDLFKQGIFSEVLSDYPYVVSFYECWGLQTDLFSRIFAHLTGRSAESLQHHFRDFGVDMKALIHNSGRLISIKDVLPVMANGGIGEPQRQIFGVLGGLVK